MPVRGAGAALSQRSLAPPIAQAEKEKMKKDKAKDFHAAKVCCCCRRVQLLMCVRFCWLLNGCWQLASASLVCAVRAQAAKKK